MERITQKDLESACKALASSLGTKYGSYTGCICLDAAYGGWKVVQITERGGQRTLFPAGYSTKREVYNQIQAAIEGIELHKRWALYLNETD